MHAGNSPFFVQLALSLDLLLVLLLTLDLGHVSTLILLFNLTEFLGLEPGMADLPHHSMLFILEHFYSVF